jgi:radical SAM protein with 4Fe4S-binding SPASM domain
VRRVLQIFKDQARIPFFSFTGGEPLLRRDLETMIRFARRLGLRVNLITNGTLADRARARRLRRAGLGSAQVSVESPEEAVHDGLTGVRGSLRATLEGIRCLREAGVSVQTNTTLNRLNAATVEALPAFLAGLGVRRFSMNLFIPAGRGLERGELFFPYSRTGAVVERVRRKARELGLEFSWYSPLPYCLFNPVARGLGNKSCAAVDGLLSVSPAGDVLPCSSYPEAIGNLLRQSFPEIWFSERARYFKQKRYAPAECSGCESFLACQGACPLYWSYAGTGELSSATAVSSSRKPAGVRSQGGSP